MRRHCYKKKKIIPSSASWAPKSLTSSPCFRTCKTTKWLQLPTSRIISASVQSSLIVPRYTVFQRSSLPTFSCVLLSVRTTGRTVTTHAYLVSWTRTSKEHLKHMQTSRTKTSTTTWRDNFMLGTRSSSHQAQPLSVRETLNWVSVCSVDPAEVTSLWEVQVEGVVGAAPPVKKAQYSLTSNDVSAAPGAGLAAPGLAAPAAADEDGQD
jgi:hypothetical protein